MQIPSRSGAETPGRVVPEARSPIRSNLVGVLAQSDASNASALRDTPLRMFLIFSVSEVPHRVLVIDVARISPKEQVQ
jgi:hypothetical protein